MLFAASQTNGGQDGSTVTSFLLQLMLGILVAAPIYLTRLYMSGVLPTYNHDNFRENCDWGCKEYLPDLPEGCQLNLLLIGQTGHGKSAFGNYLLGEDLLQPQPATGGLLRSTVGSASTIVGRRRLSVVEATVGGIPSGLDFDDDDSLEKAVSVSPGGYHAIIIVISSVVKISGQDKTALLYLPALFGERFFNFAVFVFTHCDVYASKNSLTESTSARDVSAHILSTLDPEIKQIMKMAGNRYFFVNSMDGNLFNQRLLLFSVIETVDALVDRNQGSNYSNDDFKAARELVYRSQQSETTGTEISENIIPYIVRSISEYIQAIVKYVKSKLPL
ncbi:immune-associated nucleotide-binding protein 7-like isoform X1 [Haliotis rubra]|uniref:immune-associated nucleotide-binding protein 7-like isoform X1 n=1 Tax=Haliotis rubra TaxID=36100 RepID=UPI001EE5C215|nr:immune-associated nucleotide-binding protein 7-like isoform X1 [Haliotis rubra]